MRAILFIALLACLNANAQVDKYKNISQFDDRWFHFGFMLGMNTSDFFVRTNPNALEEDSLLNFSHKSQPGFNLGIISQFNFTKWLKLRIVPSLSFQERALFYTFQKDGVQVTEEHKVESTYLDFPVLLKFRTLRIGNFAAYFLAGAQYSLDLASKEDADQNPFEPILKISKHDWAAQVGAGVDFFLPYFKFGIEFKYSFGLTNTLIQDASYFSNPMRRLNTKVMWISFTFEG